MYGKRIKPFVCKRNGVWGVDYGYCGYSCSSWRDAIRKATQA